MATVEEKFLSGSERLTRPLDDIAVERSNKFLNYNHDQDNARSFINGATWTPHL